MGRAIRSASESGISIESGLFFLWSNLETNKTKHLTFLFFAALLGLTAYSNSFKAPFQWDGNAFIKGNPAVMNPSSWFSPIKIMGPKYYSAFKQRSVTYMTFALNYRLHGFDVMGYHIFNFIIHAANAFLAYLLVIQLLRSPYLRRAFLSSERAWIAFFVCLFFISHPVQTMAVTYIYQRLTSLVAFFYLASVNLYLAARLGRKRFSKAGCLSLAVLCAATAMKTKQNAFTIPVIAVVIEFLFFKGRIAKRAFRLVPLFLTMLIIPLSMVHFDRPIDDMMNDFGDVTQVNQGVTRRQYLLTQFRVITTYIRLLLLPVNQTVLYDFPTSHSFFELKVLISFLFLSVLFGGAVFLIFLSRKRRRELRLIGFGIIWFFITLSVESSIIPLLKIQEYRVYLPSIGFITAAITGLYVLKEKIKKSRMKRGVPALLLAISFVLAAATYTRNRVYRDKHTFWADVMEKSPKRPEVHNYLGMEFRSEGKREKAKQHFLKAIELGSLHAPPYNNLGMMYMVEGEYAKAERYYMQALKLDPANEVVHSNLGNVYFSMGRIEESITHYKKAIKLKPNFPEAHNNLGAAYKKKGMLEEAGKEHQRAIDLKPDYYNARYNLALVMYEQGKLSAALKECMAALNLNRDFPQAQRLYRKIKAAVELRNL